MKVDVPMGEVREVKLLDRGFVRLVDHMGDDLSVVRAARVSHDAAWRAGQDQGSDDKLIRYLMIHRHSTPFEAVTFTFEVKAPIFVFRQWHRHRTWSYNELSARYRELPEEYYVPRPEHVGDQSTKNKQSRLFVDGEPSALAFEAASIINESSAESFRNYHKLLARGVPRELARSVLPVNTYSHMFATTNLHNLFHFLGLRADAHAQFEIRCYAEAMIQLIEPIVPVSVDAWRGFRQS